MRQILLLSLVVFAPVSSLVAQRVERTGWAVRHAAHVDLWYHSLAVVGFQGFGAVPLYDPGYAPAIHAAKTALGIPPTTLDRQAPVLLEAFRADSIFEVLHFLPVYFALASRVDMLDALDAVAQDPKRAAEESGPRTQFGVGVAGALFTSEEQRRTLAAFVSAVRQEWNMFYRDYRSNSVLPEAETHTAAAQRWVTDSIAPPLRTFLERWHLANGLALLSPAVGLDGRFFDGDPDNDKDNVVIVGYAPVAGMEAFQIVREWCYPAVREAEADALVGGSDRVAAEAESGRAAVRCGELVLDRYLPAATRHYRSAFVPDQNVVSRADLAARYPIPKALERALTVVVAQ